MSFYFYKLSREEALQHFLILILIEPLNSKNVKICVEKLKLQVKRTIPVRFFYAFLCLLKYSFSVLFGVWFLLIL